MKTQIAKIKEIFESIQGEGIFIGEKHLFVRFAGCNLNCAYCDTDYREDTNSFICSPASLYEKIKESNAKTVSFTGGEPLLHSEFLYEFLKEYKFPLKKKIYLETNGSLPYRLREVIDYIDIVAMDIKLKSSSGIENHFAVNDEFLLVAKDKDVFVKIVFDSGIKDKEIDEVCTLAKKHNAQIILQPKMPMDNKEDLVCVFEKFYKKHTQIRLISQMHKFLNLP